MKKTRKADTETHPLEESQPDGLTDKQRRFCEEYVIDWNGTRAAIAAGYAESGARVEAVRLLTNANVKTHIDELRAKTAELAGVSALRVAKEFAKIAFQSAAVLRESWEEVKEWDDLTDEEKSILAEVETVEKVIRGGGEDLQVVERKLKYKTHDKQKALTELKKMFGYDAAEKIEIATSPLKILDDL